MDERRLAGAGVAADEDKQARAVCTTVKGAEERGHLWFASVHAVRHAEEHGVIFFAESEDRGVHTAFLEVLEATLQIMS